MELCAEGIGRQGKLNNGKLLTGLMTQWYLNRVEFIRRGGSIEPMYFSVDKNRLIASRNLCGLTGNRVSPLCLVKNFASLALCMKRLEVRLLRPACHWLTTSAYQKASAESYLRCYPAWSWTVTRPVFMRRSRLFFSPSQDLNRLKSLFFRIELIARARHNFVISFQSQIIVTRGIIKCTCLYEIFILNS